MTNQLSETSNLSSTRSSNSAVEQGFLERYLPFLLFRSYALLTEEYHEGLDDLDLDVTASRILDCLADFGPCSLHEIQELAAVIQTTASRACTRLEERGLISRRVGDGDRRHRIFELTDAGRATSERLIAMSKSTLADALARTDIDPDALACTLRRLIDDLTPETT